MDATYPDPVRRTLITVPLMLAATMVAIDMTIANVALPHMQATLSASQEQSMWVLTSYLIAGAIMTPLGAWLTGRFGWRPVMVSAVSGFTLASGLCGAANDLSTMLIARALQGASGAMLLPMAQAILLDINPPENHGRAMAIYSLGGLAGPVAGPTLGGWLTDSFSWRWIFFVNIPIGIFAVVTMAAFVPSGRGKVKRPFDMFGFLTVSATLACIQLMLDRGEQLDWFSSGEIRLYALGTMIFGYLAVVHILTTNTPFIPPALFKDRNFALGCLFAMVLGVVTMAAVPMIVVMMQNLLGYSAFHTGIVSSPRAMGMGIAVVAIARFVNRIDTRIILSTGMAMTAVGLAMYAQLSLYTDEHLLIVAGFIQGFGAGLVFVPLSVVAFATLERSLRNEGVAMFVLTRNIGTAIGISLLQRELIHHAARSQSHLSESVRPDNPNVQYGMPDFDFTSTEALVRMSRDVVRQASMVASVELYGLLAGLSLVVIPAIFFLRPLKRESTSDMVPVLE